MPYVNKPRPYKKEYEQQKARGEHETRMDRQRARNEMDKNGEIKSVLIEVKPDIQTRPPVRKNTPTGKPTRRFINEVMTWGVNQAKWEAATKYSIERNWEFKIITDKDLR